MLRVSVLGGHPKKLPAEYRKDFGEIILLTLKVFSRQVQCMPAANHETQRNTDPCNLFSFDEFLRGRNLTRTTGWRYRQNGFLETVNIFGRLYITREEIEKFERRAIAGEFSKEVKTPARRELAAA